MEQFYNSFGNTEKKLQVMERRLKTCVKAGEFANKCEQARLQEPGQEKTVVQGPRKKREVSVRKCVLCSLNGHSTDKCHKRLLASQPSRKERGTTMHCYNCGKTGWSCPEKGALLCQGSVLGCQNVKDTTCLNRMRSVEGQKVMNILLDTGCSRTMINERWVPQERRLEEKMVSARCAHGDTELYPLADIRMKVGGIPIQVEVAVVNTLPFDVLLGEDVKQLSNLLGRKVPRNITEKVAAGGDGMVAVTRARARQELEEEILRRGKEVHSACGGFCSQIEGGTVGCFPSEGDVG